MFACTWFILLCLSEAGMNLGRSKATVHGTLVLPAFRRQRQGKEGRKEGKLTPINRDS